MCKPQKTNLLPNKMDNYKASLAFLFIVLLPVENIPFVILSVLSNDIIRYFLWIEYQLCYKDKLIKMFRFVFFYYLKIL